MVHKTLYRTPYHQALLCHVLVHCAACKACCNSEVLGLLALAAARCLRRHHDRAQRCSSRHSCVPAESLLSSSQSPCHHSTCVTMLTLCHVYVLGPKIGCCACLPCTPALKPDWLCTQPVLATNAMLLCQCHTPQSTSSPDIAGEMRLHHLGDTMACPRACQATSSCITISRRDLHKYNLRSGFQGAP